jgi:hypothetical protein
MHAPARPFWDKPEREEDKVQREEEETTTKDHQSPCINIHTYIIALYYHSSSKQQKCKYIPAPTANRMADGVWV